MLPKVLIIGSGGVGAIASLSLTTNGLCETSLVARSDFSFLSENGYTFNSVTYGQLSNWKPHKLFSSVAEAAENGPYDFVVLTTKNIPDGPITCEDIIRPAVTDGFTSIVLIQNGLGIEKPIIDEFPNCAVISAVSLIGTANHSCVITNLLKDIIYLAPFEHPTIASVKLEQATEEFAKLYQNANPEINSVIVEKSAARSRWDKLISNTVLNPITAITGLDLNRCQINGANKTILAPAMDEVYAIAASEGVTIDPATKNKFLHLADGSFFQSSMLVDLKKGQLVELEVILGNPLKIARKNKVETPILSTVYQLLKMIQFGTREKMGLVVVDEANYKGENSDEYPQIFARDQEKLRQERK